MRGDERFAALRMNAMMFGCGLLIMGLVAVVGALFGGPAEPRVGDAIVVTARVVGPAVDPEAQATNGAIAGATDDGLRGGGS